ncbi:MAG: hypothetical protein GY913_24940 [Proteobacteria bacterium]|nr:hypothetical protein [Pseudomonadota bacterium]MCP4920161.1 hypothetical protein [Pseudomonadota bacterium]
MSETRVFDDLESWLAACVELKVRGVAIQRVDEIRPRLHGSGVTVAPVFYATLVGYAGGVVLRARVEDPPADLAARLEGQGFKVRLANHNVG